MTTPGNDYMDEIERLADRFAADLVGSTDHPEYFRLSTELHNRPALLDRYRDDPEGAVAAYVAECLEVVRAAAEVAAEKLAARRSTA